MTGTATFPTDRRQDRARAHVDAAYAELLDAAAELQRGARNDCGNRATGVVIAMERALGRAAVTVAAISDTLAAHAADRGVSR